MAITVEGAKFKCVKLDRNAEGRYDFTGDYELMGSNGVVLAKQSVNGYNDLKVTPSPETMGKIRDLLEGLTRDLNLTLGLE